MDDMHAVHLSRLDLSSLLLLDALLEEHSVTAAARRVGLSQSAASHALSRLRAALEDPLLVRGKSGLVPTARAQALHAPLSEALAALSRAVAPPEPFDPARARRRFSVAAADYAELVLAPRLLQRIAAEAPGVELWFRTAAEEATEQLTEGKLDLALGPLRPDIDRPGIRTRTLFEERFVCVVRKGHPALRRRWTAESFAAMDHAFIAPRGRPGGAVDGALAELGLERRVRLATPHFLAAPFVIAQSDLVLTLVERVAEVLAGPLGLVLVEPPVKLPSFSLCMFWHERAQEEPAHAWLREQVARTASALERPAPRRKS